MCYRRPLAAAFFFTLTKCTPNMFSRADIMVRRSYLMLGRFLSLRDRVRKESEIDAEKSEKQA